MLRNLVKRNYSTVFRFAINMLYNIHKMKLCYFTESLFFPQRIFGVANALQFTYCPFSSAVCGHPRDVLCGQDGGPVHGRGGRPPAPRPVRAHPQRAHPHWAEAHEPGGHQDAHKGTVHCSQTLKLTYCAWRKINIFSIGVAQMHGMCLQKSVFKEKLHSK